MNRNIHFLSLCLAPLILFMSSSVGACVLTPASGVSYVSGCPKDIIDYIDKESQCYHWQLKVKEQSENTLDAEMALSEKKCDKIACLRRAYLQTYERNKKIHDVLTGALTRIMGDLWNEELKNKELDTLCQEY